MVSRIRGIGFIGLGNLGSRLAGRIATAQRAPVAVFDMDRARTAQHARTYRTVNTDCAADAVRDADVVITCLPRSKDVKTVVEELIHAPNALKKNTVWIDCTSGEPSASAALAQKLQQAPSCVSWLDCAVSGGPAGAEKGTLAALCGGDKWAFEHVKPIIDSFSSHSDLFGPAGSGHAVKAVNNALMATHIWVAAEGLVGLAKMGICPEKAAAAISQSSGRSWATQQRIPDHVLTRTFDYGFSIELLRKDVDVCIGVMRDLKLDTPMLDLAAAAVRSAEQKFGPGADHVEMVKILEREAGIQLQQRPRD